MNTKKKPYTYKYRQFPQTAQYGKGGFWSKVGGTAYGILEGTLDTITGGLTDTITDKGYAALSKLDGTDNDEEINKFRGAGTMAGAVVGGIVSGNVAGASQQGLKGASQTFTNSKVSNTLSDLSQVAGVASMVTGGLPKKTPAPDQIQSLMPTSIPSPTPSMGLKLPKNLPIPIAYGGPIYRKLGPLRPMAYGGPTDPPRKGLITINEMGAGNRMSFTGDDKKDNWITQQINTGKWGYNSSTGALEKLPTALKGISEKDQTRGTRGYTEESRAKELGKEHVRNTYGEAIMNPAFQAAAYATPWGMAAGAMQGAANLLPDTYDFAKDPSWSGAGAIGMDALMMLPAAKGVGKALGAEKKGYVSGSYTPDYIDLRSINGHAPGTPEWNRLNNIIAQSRQRSYLSKPKPVNKSGLTKEEVLQKASGKDKDVVSKMSETEFGNTVFKPDGKVVSYKPGTEIEQLTHDLGSRNLKLKDATQMSNKEYANAFNERLDLLNDIIAQRNKSGVEYRVKGLDESGRLTFYTPAGQKAKNPLIKGGLEDVNIPEGESSWGVRLNPGQWRGNVEDIANPEYFRSIPGLEMSNTTSGVFADHIPRRGTGAYDAINEYLKKLDLGRVKPGFNSQTDSSRGAWENFIKSGRGVGFYANPRTVYGTMKTIIPPTAIIGAGAASGERTQAAPIDFSAPTGMSAEQKAYGGPIDPPKKKDLFSQYYAATGQDMAHLSKVNAYLDQLAEAESFSGLSQSSKNSSAKGFYHYLDDSVKTADQRIKNIQAKNKFDPELVKLLNEQLKLPIEKRSREMQSIMVLSDHMESPTAPYRDFIAGKVDGSELYYRGHHTEDSNAVSSKEKVKENWNNAGIRIKERNAKDTRKLAYGGPTDPPKQLPGIDYTASKMNQEDVFMPTMAKDSIRTSMKDGQLLIDYEGGQHNVVDFYKKYPGINLNPLLDSRYGKGPKSFDTKGRLKMGDGGPTNTDNMRFKYAAGGELQSIDTGGSHEENPMGGVPMGPSASVEEGETVKDDFVFSDRIKVTKDIAREFSLPKSYVGKTYAAASKIGEKHNKHNDHIDAKTNELITDRLTEAQEAWKAVHMPEQNPMMAQGMHQMPDGTMMPDSEMQGQGMPQQGGMPGMPEGMDPAMMEQMMAQGAPPQMMAYGGRIGMAYGGRMPYDQGGLIGPETNPSASTNVNSSWDADSVQKVIDTYAKDAPITGETMLEYANKYNISIELALAQALNESHFGTKGRAVKTKNVFNVGNTDGGDGHDANDPNFSKFNKEQESWEKGLDNYFSLMANEYGASGKTYEEVIQGGVVRTKDNARYATNKDYEKNLLSSIGSFRNIPGTPQLPAESTSTFVEDPNRGRKSTIESEIKPAKVTGVTSVKGYNPTPTVEPFAVEEGPDTEASALRTLEDEVKSLEEKRKNIMLKKSPSLQDSKDLIELNNSISAKRKEFTNIQAPNKARARGFTVFEDRENLEDILKQMRMPYEDVQKILRDPVATRKIQDILENENSYSGSVDRAAKFNQITNFVSTHDFQDRVRPDQAPRPERSTMDPMMSLQILDQSKAPRYSNYIQTEDQRAEKISGVAYPEDTFVHTEDTDAPFLNWEDTMAQLKQDQINDRAREPEDSPWKDFATNKGRQRPADKKGFLSGFKPDASMLEYAPVIANTIQGLSKPARLDKNDYTYQSSVTATPYNIEPQQRAARNAYATAQNAGRAASSDAGSYMSSLGNLYGAYTAQNSGLYAEKENQEAQRLMAAQSAADQASQFNSQMGFRVDDWNQSSVDATRNHLMTAADQLGQIGGRESNYDYYRNLFESQGNVTLNVGDNRKNKEKKALGGYFYKPKNS